MKYFITGMIFVYVGWLHVYLTENSIKKKKKCSYIFPVNFYMEKKSSNLKQNQTKQSLLLYSVQFDVHITLKLQL